jgi:hypothetical protein
MYLIRDGVRRAVAAREAGKSDVLATIVAPGKPDVLTRIDINLLYSPKAAIVRDYRYIRDTEYPTLVLRTEPPPILVEPLPPSRHQYFTPITNVPLQ